MREIKFRAIPTDERMQDMQDILDSMGFYSKGTQYDGTFVYGYLAGGYVIGKTIEATEDYFTPQYWIPVKEETVGQYTGFKDKNGVEIYEGDICNCREYECFGKVEWNNEEAGFYFCVVMEGGGFEEEHLYDYVDELEVIGNIYENPELLKEDS